MLKKEEWLLIQVLHSKGFCISEIARQIDHDRKTVRKYLNLKMQPEPYKCLTRPSKLDPYKLTYSKGLMKIPVPLLVSIVKSRIWALMEEKLA
ncbi:hypothetical protein A9239_03430 [Methanosarcina sp. A14]|uniref:Transposase n=1 Tax=Methanosarcina barkeri CM1 TaxID=796385 RepID=A0A0G3C8F0_METBA|nr:transposase [Methanosarcina barkeri CM1]OEC91200.1 hypothetical protein A9239_03430 [Methanosarcina sp. A14]